MNIGIIASQGTGVVVPVDSPPSVPDNITISQILETSVQLDWADATDDNGVTGYNVYVGAVKHNASLLAASNYSLTGLTAGTTYEVTIESVDSIGQTAVSVVSEFTTAGSPVGGVVTDITYASTYGSGQKFGYKKYVPGNYNASTPMPLVVWLHGQGERSTDTGNPQFWKLASYGPFWEIANNNRQYPFLMIAPQQPEQVTGKYTNDRTSFDNNVINESLNHFKAQGYNIDLNRVYFTGQSMGGGGCVAYLRDHGDTVAAAFIICPIATSSNMCLPGIKNTPQWYVHNRQDNIVQISSTINYINNMNACTPAPPIVPKATIFDGGLQHNGWQAVYGETSPGTLSSDGSIGIPAGYNEPYPESGTGLNWYEWLLQYSI